MMTNVFLRQDWLVAWFSGPSKKWLHKVLCSKVAKSIQRITEEYQPKPGGFEVQGSLTLHSFLPLLSCHNFSPTDCWWTGLDTTFMAPKTFCFSGYDCPVIREETTSTLTWLLVWTMGTKARVQLHKHMGRHIADLGDGHASGFSLTQPWPLWLFEKLTRG